jgi:methylisocitrate lyase
MGARLRSAVAAERPLQIVGVINAYCAVLAESAGFRALYLSGSGVANASVGVPDLGLINLGDVLTDLRRVTAVTSLPVLVDADTGWGGLLALARATRELIASGAAGLHVEDQVQAKRCGHRPGKSVVPAGEMVDRIAATVDARSDPGFVIMARTDAAAVEGLDAAIERAGRYVEAGADMIFAEAVEDLEGYRRFTRAVGVPVLANLTEFGKTPLFTPAELREAGIAMALYPLSAFRAMSAAALRTYQAIRTSGTQKEVLPTMQTRDELYRLTRYHEYEAKLDGPAGKDGADGQ